MFSEERYFASELTPSSSVFTVFLRDLYLLTENSLTQSIERKRSGLSPITSYLRSGRRQRPEAGLLFLHQRRLAVCLDGHVDLSRQRLRRGRDWVRIVPKAFRGGGDDLAAAANYHEAGAASLQAPPAREGGGVCRGSGPAAAAVAVAAGPVVNDAPLVAAADGRDGLDVTEGARTTPAGQRRSGASGASLSSVSSSSSFSPSSALKASLSV